MALSRLDTLYRTVVTEHSKHPHHHGKLPDGTLIELHNPTCGDVIELSVRFDTRGRVDAIAFDGSGCTISTASASMMTDVVLGKSRAEIEELAAIFSRMVQGEEDADQNRLEDASLLAGVAQFPQRIKCATLSWNAIKKAIEYNERKNGETCQKKE